MKKGRIAKISLLVFLILALAANVALVLFEGHANLYFGKGELVITQAEGTENWDSEYYTMDYTSSDALKVAAGELVQDITDEGMVLLKNNGALPLNGSEKLTLLGRGSVDSVYGGSGSGAASSEGLVDLPIGLEAAGFALNPTVLSLLNDWSAHTIVDGFFGPVKEYDNPKSTIVMDNPDDSTYMSGEMPVTGYTPDAISSFASYNDAAIVTISRPAGEGGDLSQNIKGWDDNYVTGQHQLELYHDEIQAIELAKEYFDTVIIIVNSSAAMELGMLEDDPQIDAILNVGFPGKTGFYSVGQILNGAVNPSGHTVDIFPSDFTLDPTFNNFGNFEYKNTNDTATFVQYEEGIYVGYRYYETAAAEGFIDYDEAVVYPFGFGLSYTTFDWEVISKDFGDTNEAISVTVKVTNTGTVAGKDVVELYYSAPYYVGGIEKAEVVLGDFAKTSLLAPGETEELTLTFLVEDMASYDYKIAKAYVLDEGTYDITLQTDSHNLKAGTDVMTYDINTKVVFDSENPRTTDQVSATNQFDDVSAMFTDEVTTAFATNLSRSDFAGTFPTKPIFDDKQASEIIIAGFAPYDVQANINPDAVMPTTKAENGMSLIDYRGIAYDDPAWDLLLDQLDPAEMVNVMLNGAYTSLAMSSVGKPVTIDIDGPAGLSSFMGTAIKGTAYPSEVVIAQTWNVELAAEMGQMVGNEALDLGVNGWYAPALNLHRSPFAGRNFEYYSEDPVVAGKITEAVIEGAASKGLYTYIKHFALNDQETNRVNNGVAVWANEQAIRELYLSGFEKAIKNATTNINYISDSEGTMATHEIGAATAVMSSFNRIGTTWAGGSSALLETVLRDEWGFEGVVISDFNLYDHMNGDQGIANGTDYYITFDTLKSIEDTTSASAVTTIRKAAHRLLYTVANSNAMNGIVPGTTISYTTPTWKIVQYSVDGLLVIGLAVGFVLSKKKKPIEITE